MSALVKLHTRRVARLHAMNANYRPVCGGGYGGRCQYQTDFGTVNCKKCLAIMKPKTERLKDVVEVEIKVKCTGSGNLARACGLNITASCTQSLDLAAERCAEKVFGHRPHTVELHDVIDAWNSTYIAREVKHD